jgi:hypothetical protein
LFDIGCRVDSIERRFDELFREEAATPDDGRPNNNNTSSNTTLSTVKSPPLGPTIEDLEIVELEDDEEDEWTRADSNVIRRHKSMHEKGSVAHEKRVALLRRLSIRKSNSFKYKDSLEELRSHAAPTALNTQSRTKYPPLTPSNLVLDKVDTVPENETKHQVSCVSPEPNTILSSKLTQVTSPALNSNPSVERTVHFDPSDVQAKSDPISRLKASEKLAEMLSKRVSLGMFEKEQKVHTDDNINRTFIRPKSYPQTEPRVEKNLTAAELIAKQSTPVGSYAEVNMPTVIPRSLQQVSDISQCQLHPTLAERDHKEVPESKRGVSPDTLTQAPNSRKAHDKAPVLAFPPPPAQQEQPPKDAQRPLTVATSAKETDEIKSAAATVSKVIGKLNTGIFLEQLKSLKPAPAPSKKIIEVGAVPTGPVTGRFPHVLSVGTAVEIFGGAKSKPSVAKAGSGTQDAKLGGKVESEVKDTEVNIGDKPDKPVRKKRKPKRTLSGGLQESIQKLEKQIREGQAEEKPDKEKDLAKPVTEVPFQDKPGEISEKLLKASRFGQVVAHVKKPGHHVGPAKNPNCSCESCARFRKETTFKRRPVWKATVTTSQVEGTAIGRASLAYGPVRSVISAFENKSWWDDDGGGGGEWPWGT